MSGLVVWFTGRPASGKTTLAQEVLALLRAEGETCCLLDGDEVRNSLRPRPGYGEAARTDFYQTLGALAGLLSRQGLVVLVAATAHRRSYREAARGLAADRFAEVFVDTPAEECERRDPKGLYGRARAGQTAEFPGVHQDYEPPGEEALRVAWDERDSAAARVAAAILGRGCSAGGLVADSP